MSISFSGIASGLDTSSWIESLVALRRAKITSLQTQREELVTTQDTLNNIRSFFNTFKTTVQKITDSKFGNTSLFGRNIATSSNLGVLSATANSLAQAASYQIKVDQLATKTTATSGFKQTITEESVAGIEETIDRLEATLKPTKGFILPGSTESSARANVCRTVCRRAERRITDIAAEIAAAPEVMAYINRLSDYFFLLQRVLDSGIEKKWEKACK